MAPAKLIAWRSFCGDVRLRDELNRLQEASFQELYLPSSTGGVPPCRVLIFAIPVVAYGIRDRSMDVACLQRASPGLFRSRFKSHS